MLLTVEDLMKQDLFKDLKLIAGDKGLTNEVKSCGILDYEYEWEVKDKYSKTNFNDGQFILSSFLYLKENPFLIIDAIQYLVSKGCSGIAIKNVFNIPIHDNIIRYANSIGFPIFIFGGTPVYFEEIIVLITRLVDQVNSQRDTELAIDKLLKSLEDSKLQRKIIKELFPSIRSDIVCVYMYPKEEITREFLDEVMNKSKDSTLIRKTIVYRNGLLFIYTQEYLTSRHFEILISEIAENSLYSSFNIGISDIFRDSNTLGRCIQNSIYASIGHSIISKDARFLKYEDLGLYALIIPHYNSELFKNFSYEIISKLVNWDFENNAALLPTTIEYIKCGADINKTAINLGQHKNTIRYRLNTVNKVLDMDIFKIKDYEVISYGIKIYLCEKAFENYKRIIIT